MLEEIVIRKALPEDAEDIAKLYNEVYRGNYSLLSFTKPHSVEALVKDERYKWYIAHSKEGIIGSAVAEINKWNNSAEYGKGVVKKEFSGKGIMKALLKQAKNDEQDYLVDLSWSQVRNEPIYRICSMILKQEMIGYLPGAHLVNERETFLMSIGLLESGKKKRVISHAKEIYSLPLVKRIIQNMGLEEGAVANYPQDIIICPKEGETISLNGFYHPREKSLILSSISNWNFEPPQYLQATVLIDKIEYIELLQKYGFSITGFLPAWFLFEDKRYDCVLMTNPLIQPIANDNFLKDFVKEFSIGFQGGKNG